LVVVKSTENFYSNGGRTEIDLRAEFNKTRDGSFPEIAKFQSGLQRIFRLDSNGRKIVCSCTDPVTGEPDKERRCNSCLGEGFYWDESPILFYHTYIGSDRNIDTLYKPGDIITDVRMFYISTEYDLTKSDKLVLLTLDKEGKVTSPLKRENIYKISLVQKMRLDNGRLEFWKVTASEEDNKHL
jgi:hypothetical protein